MKKAFKRGDRVTLKSDKKRLPATVVGVRKDGTISLRFDGEDHKYPSHYYSCAAEHLNKLDKVLE